MIPILVLDGPVLWLCFALTIMLGVPLGIAFGLFKMKSTQSGSSFAPPSPRPVFQISRDGQIIGTYDSVALQHLIRSGFIQRNDDYWSEGMPTWQKVGSRTDWFPPT